MASHMTSHMTSRLLLILVLSVYTTCVVTATMQDVARESNNFALDLYRHLLTTNHTRGNILFSPLSISLTFAMTYAGAREETKTQMAEVMHFEDAAQNMHEAYHEILEVFKAPTTLYTMDIANKLFASRDFKYVKAFLDITGKQYGAHLEKLDFTYAADAVEHINDWVSEQTNMKITDLLTVDSISEDTVLVLVNAVYFKGLWKKAFNRNDTELRPFFTGGDTSQDIDMMYTEAELGYKKFPHLKSVFLRLPYTGDAVDMFVLLPTEKDGIRDLETALDDLETLEDLFNVREELVKVILPKFKLDEDIDLKLTLKAMGMSDLFEQQKADLSGITVNKSELFVSEAAHRAVIEVNEVGTEAAAATEVAVTLLSAASEEPLFNADHPFIYFLRERTTGAILFMGRFSDPSAIASGSSVCAQVSLWLMAALYMIHSLM